MSSSLAKLDAKLAEEIALYYANPLGFVWFAYPWGRKGSPLANATGPCPCQVKVLTILGEEVQKRGFDGVHAVKPIRIAVSSGHGIGKSGLAAMIADWASSTRPWVQGTMTANTRAQLETKTWAAVQHWTKMSINAHWFETSQSLLFRRGFRESWFIQALTCDEDKSESFAGQHAQNSTSLYINDEASAIPDPIFEVQEGGLTDGEPIQLMFGNPTRSQGKFYRVMFGSEGGDWRRIIIDSRECPLSNKELIAEWEADYGEDSDFFRVRVRGLHPKAADSQFISIEAIHAAQKLAPTSIPDDPLIAGVDLAWGGGDPICIRFRKGHDARSISPIYIKGDEIRDEKYVTMKLANILDAKYEGEKIDMMFIDAAGICGPVGRRLREMGHKNIVEVNFGAHSPDPQYENMRSYMYGMAKDDLEYCAIDSSAGLEEDLSAPGYTITPKTSKKLLENKKKIIKRLGHSTDDGDAHVLTYAAPVRKKQPPKPPPEPRGMRARGRGWMR